MTQLADCSSCNLIGAANIPALTHKNLSFYTIRIFPPPPFPCARPQLARASMRAHAKYVWPARLVPGYDKLPWLRNSQLTKAYVLGAYSLCAQVCVACKFLRWADGRQKWSLASRERDEATKLKLFLVYI